jgi:hypothetical protein
VRVRYEPENKVDDDAMSGGEVVIGRTAGMHVGGIFIKK